MKYFFCLIPKEDSAGINIGRRYAYDNRDKWVEGDIELSTYLASGYTNGVDFVVHNGIAYYVKKSYLDLAEKFVVLVCKESIEGCDKVKPQKVVLLNDTDEDNEEEVKKENAE